jgi:hypothetical protein
MIIESHRSMFRYFKKYDHKRGGWLCLYGLGIVLLVSGLVRAAAHYPVRK